MTDTDRGTVIGNDERLPWLEAVDDEEAAGTPGAGRLVAAVIVALAIIGLFVGGLFWLRDREGDPSGQGELIAAPKGPYKTKPGEPGGMKVEGQGDTAYAASEGAETNTAIDLTAVPEAPVTSGGAVTSADTAAAAPQAAMTAGKVPTGPTPAPAKIAQSTGTPAPAAASPPAAAAPKAEPPATGGRMVQLGAFSSDAKARAAWKAMSARFGFLAPLASTVIPVASGTSTLYRLRATAGDQAGAVCAKLKVAGESCTVIG